MIRPRGLYRMGLVSALLLSIGDYTQADEVWNVSLDTSQLAANYGGGPFGLDFELIGTSGNTVTLSNFTFGGGSAGPGSAFVTGGTSGDLGSSVSLNDSSAFFSDFNQQFTPGATLSFTVDSTLVAPGPGGTPDSFSMVIFTGYDPVNGYNPYLGTGGTPIPTTDPSGADTFLTLNINGPGATTLAGYPAANGDVPITIMTAGAVPEPSSVVLAVLGLLGVMGAARWHQVSISGADTRRRRDPRPQLPPREPQLADPVSVGP